MLELASAADGWKTRVADRLDRSELGERRRPTRRGVRLSEEVGGRSGSPRWRELCDVARTGDCGGDSSDQVPPSTDALAEPATDDGLVLGGSNTRGLTKISSTGGFETIEGGLEAEASEPVTGDEDELSGFSRGESETEAESDERSDPFWSLDA